MQQRLTFAALVQRNNSGCSQNLRMRASPTLLIASRFGWTASFLVAAALCLFGALAWMIVNLERAIQPEIAVG